MVQRKSRQAYTCPCSATACVRTGNPHRLTNNGRCAYSCDTRKAVRSAHFNQYWYALEQSSCQRFAIPPTCFKLDLQGHASNIRLVYRLGNRIERKNNPSFNLHIRRAKAKMLRHRLVSQEVFFQWATPVKYGSIST